MLIIIFLRYQGTARLMFNSFGSALWMMPFSKYCRTDNRYWKHFSGGRHAGQPTYKCDEQEFQSNFSGWPTKIINIEIPSAHGMIDDSFTFSSGQSCCGASGVRLLNFNIFSQHLMHILHSQKYRSPTCLAWSVDYRLNCHSQLVKYQMAPFSRQLKIMTQTARGCYTCYKS